MTELFTQLVVPERTLTDVFELITDESTGIAPAGVSIIVGGTISGAAYKSNDSGARVEIRPEWDPTIGFVAYNASSSQVFKIEIDGTNVGDITIGNYAGAQGILWDQSAGTFNIKGTFTATAGTIGGWSINSTSIYTGTEDHSGYTANAGDMTIYSDGTNSSFHAKNFYIDIDGTLFATNANIAGTITASELHIPDEDITANSFHVESDGDTFWGCTQANFTSSIANAKAYVLKNGIAKFNNLGSSTQFVASDGTSILVKGVVAAIGSLQLGSYTLAGAPATSPTTTLSPSAIGTANWTNPTNAYSSNNVYATTTTAGLKQQYKTFGLGAPETPVIPHGSTILGLRVKVECKGDAANMEVAVRLSPDGGTVWSTAKTATPNNGSDTTLTFGDGTDLWTNISPYTWNTDTITDTYLVLDIQCSNLGSGTTLSVDHITLEVFYTTAVQAGSLIYVSDGQKAGETSSGSGNLGFWDGSNWIATDTGNTLNSGLGLKLPRLASEPAGTDGQIFYDTALDVFKGYNGAWKTLAWDADVPVAFGGDGSDGAHAGGGIDLGSALVVVKNYSSITLASAVHMTFTNPHANGTLIIIKCSGDLSIGNGTMIKIGNDSTGGQTGASGGTAGTAGVGATPATNGGNGNSPTGLFDSENIHYGSGGGAQDGTGGNGGGGGGQLTDGTNGTAGTSNESGLFAKGLKQTNFAGLFDLNNYRKTYFASCGAGGGGGAGGDEDSMSYNGDGGAGGAGGGALILEIAGNLTFSGTTTIEAEGMNGTDGEAGGNDSGGNYPRGGGAGGGGAGGTVIVLYKGTLTGTLTSCSVIGGTGGIGGINRAKNGGNGGNGSAGSYILQQYIW